MALLSGNVETHVKVFPRGVHPTFQDYCDGSLSGKGILIDSNAAEILTDAGGRFVLLPACTSIDCRATDVIVRIIE